MNFFLLLRFLHIASAMWFMGGLVSRQIVRAYAKQTDDVQRFAAMREAAERIERTMVIPGSMVVGIVGLILGFVTGAPVFGFLQGASKNWLLVSILILLLAFPLPPLIFIPRKKKLNLALTDALARGQITAEVRAYANDPVVRAAHWAELISMGVVVFLMVFKPF